MSVPEPSPENEISSNSKPGKPLTATQKMDKILEILTKIDNELEEWRPLMERYKGGISVGSMIVGAFKK